MTRDEIKIEIAKNINQLSSDETTIVDGKITETSINRKINNLYRDELFMMLSDRYPNDFERVTVPRQMYTATGTVDASSTSTTLVTTSDVFTNDMEGFYVENATDSEKIKIASYTSSTTVTLESSIGDTWDGDTIYVLGNVYTFGGDASDLKEVRNVGVKYDSSNDYFRKCERREYNDAFYYGNEEFSEYSPIFYLTTVKTDSTTISNAIGIFPRPGNYTDLLQIRYIEKPPELTGSDSPRLAVAGVGEVLVNGVTAWAKHVKGESDWGEWFSMYQDGQQRILNTYKPKARSGPSKIRKSPYLVGMRRRSF